MLHMIWHAQRSVLLSVNCSSRRGSEPGLGSKSSKLTPVNSTPRSKTVIFRESFMMVVISRPRLSEYVAGYSQFMLFVLSKLAPLCRPFGALLVFSAHPGLTAWAKLFRAFGAAIRCSTIPSCALSLLSHFSFLRSSALFASFVVEL